MGITCHRPTLRSMLRADGFSDQDNAPLMVANTLIGIWDHSQGSGANNASKPAAAAAQDYLCHSFQSFNTSHKDTGL